jgi:diacylglycerol kinase (ATP)
LRACSGFALLAALVTSMAATPKRVRVLINRKSGMAWSFDALQRAADDCWNRPGTELTYQFCKDRPDGVDKARRAAEEQIDWLIVVGGDGTVSTVGASLIGSNTAMGVVPAGSGNGFARHFGIPLSVEKAVAALADAEVQTIDVGAVQDRPFLVTCSMAWDAALAATFNRSPVRGIIPYFFAGAYELLGYEPQPMTVEVDAKEVLRFDDALIFTIANLTQYGGGAVIAPHARPDDELLELVVARRQDVAQLVANIVRLFDGTIESLPQIVFRSFRTLRVIRNHAAPIQVDGELVEAPADVTVRVLPRALRVLVPAPSRRAHE